jgi:hypothetical protein
VFPKFGRQEGGAGRGGAGTGDLQVLLVPGDWLGECFNKLVKKDAPERPRSANRKRHLVEILKLERFPKLFGELSNILQEAWRTSGGASSRGWYANASAVVSFSTECSKSRGAAGMHWFSVEG